MKLKPLKAFLFWFAVFCMSMLVMVQPARATVEQVLPVNPIIYKAAHYTAGLLSGEYSGWAAACAAADLAYPAFSTKPLGNGYTTDGYTFACRWDTGGQAGGFKLLYAVGPNPVPVSSSVCPVATPVYIYSAQSGMCEREAPACPAAGTQHSKGFFNIGTVPTGKLMNSACVSGCKIDLISGYAPAAKQKINGIYYYFGNAEYKHVGTSCTPDTPNFLSDFVGTLPGETCAAGQQMITMNGVTKCFDSTGAEIDANSASAVAAAKTLADAKTAKAIQDAQDAVAAAGGSVSDVAAAGTVAAGVAAANDSASNSGDPVMDSFCAQNPSADICKQGTAQAKAAGALPEIGSGSWYVKTYPDGVSGVLTTNFNAIKNTPLLGLLSNIVPTLSGAAHSGCFTIPVLNMGNQVICLSPLVMTFLGIAMMLTALFAARAIVFGG